MRQAWGWVRCVCLAVVLGNVGSLLAADSVELARNGASQYEIIVQADALESVQYAADELQRVIHLSTGVKLPIVHQPGDRPGKIVVGAHPLAAKAGVTTDGLVHDAYRVRVKDGNVYLVGLDDEDGTWMKYGHPRTWSAGSYNAVLYLLRQHVGAQWYTPGPEGEEIPSRQVISLPADLNVEDRPHFAIRSLDNAFFRSEYRANALHASGYFSRVYLPQRMEDINAWGRHLRLGHGYNFEVSHAWYKFMPAEKPNSYSPKAYGKDHPEYFALYKGVRQTHYHAGTHGGQLCVSNMEMIDEYARNVIAYAKKTGTRAIDLSENDGGLHCECDNCKAWDVPLDQDGKPLVVNTALRGGQGVAPGEAKPVLTDRFIRFCNEVAKRVVKEIPDATLGFYAYYDGRQPPQKQRVHPAVVISDVYNFMPYYYDEAGPLHQTLMQDIRGWRASSDGKVVLTSYYFGYGHWSLPWSTGHVLDGVIKAMAEYPSGSGMRLVMGNSHSPPMVGAWGSDMWVYAELMWDPTQSLEVLEDRYYRGAFGEQAGPLVQRHYRLIRQSMTQEMKSMPYRPSLGEVRQASQAVYPAYSRVRQECTQLLAQAEAIIGQQPERYQQRFDLVKRNWKLAELTVDMIHAINQANKASGETAARFEKEAFDFWQQRVDLSLEPGSLFAVDPRPIDHTDKHAAWGIMRIVEKYRQFSRFNEPVQLVDLSTPWRFATDPKGEGDKAGWVEPEFDDSQWKSIRVNRAWELQGYENYDGVAWYRRLIGGLKAPEGKRLVLYFGAVDGDADVYINGKHLGRHEGDVGDGDGWQDPFWYDITDAVNPSGLNTIVVRVHDTAGHGGIHKNAEIIHVKAPVPQWYIPEN